MRVVGRRTGASRGTRRASFRAAGRSDDVGASQHRADCPPRLCRRPAAADRPSDFPDGGDRGGLALGDRDGEEGAVQQAPAAQHLGGEAERAKQRAPVGPKLKVVGCEQLVEPRVADRLGPAACRRMVGEPAADQVVTELREEEQARRLEAAGGEHGGAGADGERPAGLGGCAYGAYTRPAGVELEGDHGRVGDDGDGAARAEPLAMRFRPDAANAEVEGAVLELRAERARPGRVAVALVVERACLVECLGPLVERLEICGRERPPAAGLPCDGLEVDRVERGEPSRHAAGAEVGVPRRGRAAHAGQARRLEGRVRASIELAGELRPGLVGASGLEHDDARPGGLELERDGDACWPRPDHADVGLDDLAVGERAAVRQQPGAFSQPERWVLSGRRRTGQ